MKVKISGLKKVAVQFKGKEGTPPPPPGTSGTSGDDNNPPPPPGMDREFEEIVIIDPSEYGETTVDDGSIDPEVLREEWKQAAQEAARTADLDEGAKMAIEQISEKAVIDWKEKLRDFVSGMGDEERYYMPNRRFVSTDDYFYTTRKESEGLGPAFVIIDTSGSMFVNKAILKTTIREAQGIFEDADPEKIYLMYCDDKLYLPVQELERGSEFKIAEVRGGGGTTFVPPFQWIKKNIIDKGLEVGPIVYFTDTEGTFPSVNDYGIRDYEDKVFWVVTYEYNRPDTKLPFGSGAYLKVQNGIK